MVAVAIRCVPALIQHRVDQLQLSSSENIQLHDAGQRGFESLSDADSLTPGPQRVHAAPAPRHPVRVVRVRQARAIRLPLNVCVRACVRACARVPAGAPLIVNAASMLPCYSVRHLEHRVYLLLSKNAA